MPQVHSGRTRGWQPRWEGVIVSSKSTKASSCGDVHEIFPFPNELIPGSRATAWRAQSSDQKLSRECAFLGRNTEQQSSYHVTDITTSKRRVRATLTHTPSKQPRIASSPGFYLFFIPGEFVGKDPRWTCVFVWCWWRGRTKFKDSGGM